MSIDELEQLPMGTIVKIIGAKDGPFGDLSAVRYEKLRMPLNSCGVRVGVFPHCKF